MKKDDDVKLSTERILFLFCILFYFIFFFCGGNFLDDPFIPHRQPAETSLFHSFLPDCVPLLAQIGFYTVTRINLVLYFIHTTSNNIPVFLFFNVFSLSLCVFSVLISGNLRIDRSSIDHDHRDNSGVVVGFSFVVQLKRIMRTKDTFTQTRIKELLEKAADWHYLFRLIFLCLLSTIFFGLVCVVSFYNCSCLSSLLYPIVMIMLGLFDSHSPRVSWPFDYSRTQPKHLLSTSTLSRCGILPHCWSFQLVALLLSSRRAGLNGQQPNLFDYTHCVVLLLPYLLSCCS